MTGESNLWARVREGLKPFGGHLIRIENYVGEGQPDVNWCLQGIEVWVELKHRPDWPKRLTTAVFKEDQGGLRSGQVRWMKARQRAGGRVFVLSQVERELFLHDIVINELSVEDFRLCARLSFRGKVDWALLALTLTGVAGVNDGR